MKMKLRILISALLITTLFVPSTVYAGTEIKIDKNGETYILISPDFDNEQGISMLQYGDILGELPPVKIYINGLLAKGTFTYPNYDNSRLGVWDLEWVFTPEDDRYEPVSGTIRVNVRAPEPEIIEEPTTPSLTATTVTLNTLTTYDINLDNKVSGSSYKWSSSNPKVAKVNAKNGLVTAVSEGTATITCEITTPEGRVQTLESVVTVGYDENAPMLTETILDLEVGNKFDINLENKIAKSKYRWVSSDRNVVIVNSSNGKVTAVGPGQAYVTCTITTPNKQVIVLRCDINVEVPSEITE